MALMIAAPARSKRRQTTRESCPSGRCSPARLLAKRGRQGHGEGEEPDPGPGSVLIIAVERDDLVSGRVGRRRAARYGDADHGENDESDPAKRQKGTYAQEVLLRTDASSEFNA